jgi:hypothetical protein
MTSLEPAHRPETGDDGMVQPNQALTDFVGLVLEAHATERERPSDRLERLDGNGDLNPWPLSAFGVCNLKAF